MKRAALFLLFLVAGACTVGVTAPVALPPPAEIAAGVTVSGVELGGLTAEPARERLRVSAARPLTVAYRQERWRLTPEELDTTAAVDDAVSRALAASSGTELRLPVRVPPMGLRRWVAKVARSLDRPVRDARFAGLVRGKPFVTPARRGVWVRRAETAEAIAAAFRSGSRRVVRVSALLQEPRVTRNSIGPIIVIDRGANTLVLYDGMRKVRSFRVATGSPRYPTPSGTWKLVDKQRYPWWYPPASDWARGLKPVPPGPGNPLGTRWMGLSAYAVGIHGTPDAASIGFSASHGCIRMNVWEAEWLFERVRLGTPVVIV